MRNRGWPQRKIKTNLYPFFEISELLLLKIIANNKAMYDMQMPVKPENYTFLDHVSFVDGHKLSTLRKIELINELSTGATQMKGRMRNEDMTMLLDAALNSPLFSEKEKDYFR